MINNAPSANGQRAKKLPDNPSELVKIKKLLMDNAEVIEKEATRQHVKYLPGDKLRRKFLEKIRVEHVGIVKEIARHLEDQSIEQGIAFFNALGEQLATKSIAEGLRIQEAVNGSIFLKQSIWKKIEDEGLLKELSAKDIYLLSQNIGTYIDVLGSRLTFAYHERYVKERENERLRLEFGQKAGRIGTYEWDLVAHTSTWTKEFEALYGYPNGGYRAESTEEWLRFVHPLDRKRVLADTVKALKNGGELNIEYRVIWPDKTIRFLANRAQIIRDKKGKATRMNGVNIDITERKLVENNLAYLSEASKILSSSLDYRTTLSNVARLAVPEIADWCSVSMKNGQEIDQLAVAHVDPKKVKWAEQLRKKSPPDKNSKTGVARVLKTGKSELYSNITDEMLVGVAKNKEELSLLRKLQMSSVLIVPFLLKGQAIGAITFVAAESGRHYTVNDLAMAEEVANRMALAIENARLYTEAKAVDELQKKLAAVVESSDDAIISKSIEGIITSWNKGATRLYGYKPEEIIGQPVSVLMPADKKDDFPMIMKKLQEGKRIEHYETKRKTKDGQVLDVAITVSPIRNVEGKIIGASKVARDITERKRNEERQEFLEQASKILGSSIDYELTLKNVGKLIVPYLADYCRIVVVNEEKQIKEIAVNHVESKKLPLVRELYDIYKDDKKNTAGVDKLLETGKPERMDITPELYKSINPKVASIIKQLNLRSYMGMPMKVGNRIVGALTFSLTRENRFYTKHDLKLAQELADRAALAIENSRLYTESQKAVALRDDFISVASHELRTPITSLKMYNQGLQMHLKKEGNDQLISPLVRMENQINKLTVLVSDLLNVSKLQHGKLEFDMEEIDLNELVKEAVDAIQTTEDGHRIIVSGEVSAKVYADKYRINQVVTNLLTNAIKYSPDSDRVVVQLIQEKNNAIVSVEDFGLGIDKEHQNKIFDQFYRVTSKEEKTYPGLGMGLYISKEIVKRHGGDIKVSSRKGKGSRFSFTLPYYEKS